VGLVAVTLLLQAVFVLLAFGWRTVAQARATGSTGFVAHRERGGAAKAAGAALTVGLLAVVAGTALADRRGWDALGVVGTAAMVAGLLVTLAAQRAMGAAWRIGVDPDEQTELVTAGPFGRVRNPVFTGMLAFAAGSALAAPNGVTVAGLLLAAGGVAAQVLLSRSPTCAASTEPPTTTTRDEPGGSCPGSADLPAVRLPDDPAGRPSHAAPVRAPREG
jgi:protein-S-isoprenylcysteine O-methyltransferase Ste14